MTYQQVMTQARNAVNVKEMELPPVKIRESATGARLIEISGPEYATKADLVAARIKEVLGDTVSVARPVKTADLRLSGLDDSISNEDVVSAICQTGNCAPDNIRTGVIRRGPRGSGTMWIQCPVTVAKTISDAGRLIIGWSAVQARLLEQRPMKCFRCFAIGHTRQRCSAPIDRSDLCFRCGKPGHKSMGCTVDPHCPICAVKLIEQTRLQPRSEENMDE
jgi:hypothetical protein